jgi:hypothetical protein
MECRPVLAATSLFAAAALSACGGSSATSTHRANARAPAKTVAAPAAPQSLGPEGIPLEAGPPLGSASSTTPGTRVDGIACAPIEQLVYHIHSHLQVYVDGQPRRLPAAIGLIGPVVQQTSFGPFYGARRCYYWLHTHATDGVIHVESPSVRIYTLGNFFDEWRQPLSRTQVADAKGTVTAFLNGKPWIKDPRAIPLLPHSSIDLDVGAPVVHPTVVSWARTSL